MENIPVQQLLHLPTTLVEGNTRSLRIPLYKHGAGDGGGSMVQTWLVFIPQWPSSPSSLRVLVWRRMRATGAAALQQGVWVLPQTPEHEQFLRDVLLEAQQQGGSGILLVATSLDADRSTEVVERFCADRDQEYRQCVVQCRDFLAEIAQETEARNLTSRRWKRMSRTSRSCTPGSRKFARDFFGALQAHTAAEALAACEHALAELCGGDLYP
jgi:hypothetical protein